MLEAYLVKDPLEKEIRLIEITQEVADDEAVLPVGFGPDEEEGVPYPSVVVLLHPDGFRRIKGRKLNLPAEWGSSPVLVPLPIQ